MPGNSSTESQVHSTSLADEEAVNKVAEKIDTLRMGPRQVRYQLKAFRAVSLKLPNHQEHEMDESTSSPNTVILADDIPDADSEIVPGKIVNIQPTAPIQSGITEEQKS